MPKRICRFCCLAPRRQNGNLPHKAAIFACANANPLLRVPQYHRILYFYARKTGSRACSKAKGRHAALFCLAPLRHNGNLPHKAAIFACANAHPLLRVPQRHQILFFLRAQNGFACCSKAKCHPQGVALCFGAGNGNRTRISCLGSRGFTTRLCLRTILLYIKSIHLSSNLFKILAKSLRQRD